MTKKNIINRIAVLLFCPAFFLLAGCENALYKTEEPPLPITELVFKSGGVEVRQGGQFIELPENPGVAGNVSFEFFVNDGQGRVVDNIEISFQHSPIIGSALPQGIAPFEIINNVQNNTISQTYSIQALNDFYWGGGTTISGSCCGITADVLDWFFVVNFADGTSVEHSSLSPFSFGWKINEDDIPI